MTAGPEGRLSAEPPSGPQAPRRLALGGGQGLSGRGGREPLPFSANVPSCLATQDRPQEVTRLIGRKWTRGRASAPSPRHSAPVLGKTRACTRACVCCSLCGRTRVRVRVCAPVCADECAHACVPVCVHALPGATHSPACLRGAAEVSGKEPVTSVRTAACLPSLTPWALPTGFSSFYLDRKQRLSPQPHRWWLPSPPLLGAKCQPACRPLCGPDSASG